MINLDDVEQPEFDKDKISREIFGEKKGKNQKMWKINSELNDDGTGYSFSLPMGEMVDRDRKIQERKFYKKLHKESAEETREYWLKKEK